MRHLHCQRGRTLSSVTAVAAALAASFVAPQPALAGVATCHGQPATVVGTDDADDLEGTDGPDVIVALGGPDTIDAGAGDDVVCAGDGQDVVEAGPGDDQVWAEAGWDQVFPGAGADTLDGGTSSRDELDYSTVAAGVHVDRVAETVESAGRTDHVTGFEQYTLSPMTSSYLGFAGTDSVFGGDSVDRLNGAGGADILAGGAGDDRIAGGTGNDVIAGNDGFDFITDVQGDDDVIDGSSSEGPIPAGEGMRFSVGPGNDSVSGAGGTIRGTTGAGNDEFVGSATEGAGLVDLGPGDDSAYFLAGLRPLTIKAGSGRDEIKVDAAAAGSRVDGGAGIDLVALSDKAGRHAIIVLGPRGRLVDSAGVRMALGQVENARAAEGHQRVIGSARPNRIWTGPGADFIDARGGVDAVDAGAGNDSCLNVEHRVGCETS